MNYSASGVCPRFLQIHTLTSHAGVLLNRDDSGLAKKMPFGGHMRTRVSSQCLKRHWRKADDDPHSLHAIDGADVAYRSRDIIDELVFGKHKADGKDDEGADGKDDGKDDEGAVIDKIKTIFNKTVYGESGDKKKSRQTLLLGKVETDYLTVEANRLVDEAAGDSKRAEALAKEWAKKHEKNFKKFSEGSKLPAGLIGALYGRMVTSDPKANIEASVYVGHAYTVHAEEAEDDYFVAIDDLADEGDTGADTIQETELTSGVFYHHQVVCIPDLLKNLDPEDTEAAAKLAGNILHNHLYLTAEVSPGAKRGSTAPFSRASFMLLEVGDRQPYGLDEAFQKPCDPNIEAAVEAVLKRLAVKDENYATGEQRFMMSLVDVSLPKKTQRGSLKDLASIASELPAAYLKSRNAA